MKEDVLEQIVDDYLQFKGYFCSSRATSRPTTFASALPAL